MNEIICTRANPWRPGLPTPVVHPEAVEINSRDGHDGGDIATMKCPTCDHVWKMELAQ